MLVAVALDDPLSALDPLCLGVLGDLVLGEPEGVNRGIVLAEIVPRDGAVAGRICGGLDHCTLALMKPVMTPVVFVKQVAADVRMATTPSGTGPGPVIAG